jgi:hypothetical protein
MIALLLGSVGGLNEILRHSRDPDFHQDDGFFSAARLNTPRPDRQLMKNMCRKEIVSRWAGHGRPLFVVPAQARGQGSKMRSTKLPSS